MIPSVEQSYKAHVEFHMIPYMFLTICRIETLWKIRRKLCDHSYKLIVVCVLQIYRLRDVDSSPIHELC